MHHRGAAPAARGPRARLYSLPYNGAGRLFISMRELIEKGGLLDAHPSQWGPFVVVGDGAR